MEMYIPYYPTKWETVKILSRILNLYSGTNVIDLGSGGGRILYGLLSKYEDIDVYGVEKNWRLVEASRQYLSKKGFHPRVMRGDLFKIDLNKFDIAYGYLTREALSILRPKIHDFLDNDKIFISFDFRVPRIKPSMRIKIDKLPGKHFLYIYGKNRVIYRIIDY